MSFTTISDFDAQSIQGGAWTNVSGSITPTSGVYKLSQGSGWGFTYTYTQVNGGGVTRTQTATYSTKKQADAEYALADAYDDGIFNKSV